MASVSQKRLHWLWSVLSKEYRDPNRAYSDLAQSLERFPTISARTDVYTFENGLSALLVHLVGTLQVSFRNMTYRFPVELWIPHDYPYEPPIAYITPTKDMLVRPGRHVSGEGRIYHPYLAQWAEAWDRSNMIELLSIFCDIFSKEPPAMSRSLVPNTHQPSSRPPPPVPPHPFEQSQAPSQGIASPTRSPLQQPPPRPPPKPPLGSDANGTPKPSPASRYDGPPPLPPENAYGGSSQPFHSNSQNSPSQFIPQRHTTSGQSMTPQQFPQQHNFDQRTLPLSGTNMPFSTPPAGGPPQFAPSASSTSQTGLPYRTHAPFLTESQSHDLSHRQSTLSAPPSHFESQSQRSTTVSNHHQPSAGHQRPPPQPKPQAVNLLDSPFDINLPVSSSAKIPAPPIPPNPEKDALLSALSQSITQTLHNDISQNAISLAPLRSQNEALNNSLRTLESELAQLQALQGTLTGNVSILQSSLRDADQCIAAAHARAQRGEIPKIDDMLTAPTVVGKQLYDVVCDERGIEAATWALQAALTRGRISVDVWARKTRELSREGFRRKVLGRKIAVGMGLEG